MAERTKTNTFYNELAQLKHRLRRLETKEGALAAAASSMGGRVAGPDGGTTVPDSSPTTLAWQRIPYGSPPETTGQTIWTPSSPTRFTAPADGLYLFNAIWDWVGLDFAGTYIAQSQFTGSLTPGHLSEKSHVPTSGSGTAVDTLCEHTATIWLYAGDFVEFELFQTSGHSTSVYDNGGLDARENDANAMMGFARIA